MEIENEVINSRYFYSLKRKEIKYVPIFMQMKVSLIQIHINLNFIKNLKKNYFRLIIRLHLNSERPRMKISLSYFF